MRKDIEDWLKELLREQEMQNAKKVYESVLVPYFEKQYGNRSNPLLKAIASKEFDKPLPLTTAEKSVYNYPIYAADNNLQQKDKTLYWENSYIDVPTIYSASQPEMKSAPKRPIEDIIKPKIENTVNDIKDNVNKAADWIENKKDILLNNKIDYSKPMIPHEQITDWFIKKPATNIFPVSSDMYTDGMTGLSRAKQNPNADIININDIKDEKLKKKIQNFGTKDNERGVHYNTDSEASKLFSNSKDVKEFYEKNKEAIKQGKITENDFNFSVSKSTDANTKILNKFDRHASIQHGTITNMKIDDKGRGIGKLIDRSDYEWRDPKEYGQAEAAINNHGYNMQEKGNYENYFSIIDILSQTENKQEALDLLEKLKKYLRMGK